MKLKLVSILAMSLTTAHLAQANHSATTGTIASAYCLRGTLNAAAVTEAIGSVGTVKSLSALKSLVLDEKNIAKSGSGLVESHTKLILSIKTSGQTGSLCENKGSETLLVVGISKK